LIGERTYPKGAGKSKLAQHAAILLLKKPEVFRGSDVTSSSRIGLVA
jgi:hypothetical protein